MLDFHNNKIKRRSTIDSIIERMIWNHTDIGLTEAERPESIARAIESTHMHIHGSVSGRLRWEPADVTVGPSEPQEPPQGVLSRITGLCPRCRNRLIFYTEDNLPRDIERLLTCNYCGRNMTEGELHGYLQ